MGCVRNSVASLAIASSGLPSAPVTAARTTPSSRAMPSRLISFTPPVSEQPLSMRPRIYHRRRACGGREGGPTAWRAGYGRRSSQPFAAPILVLAVSDVLPNLVRDLLVERETRAAHVDGVDVDELGIRPNRHGDGVDGPAATDEAGFVVTHRAGPSFPPDVGQNAYFALREQERGHGPRSTIRDLHAVAARPWTETVRACAQGRSG